MQPYTPQFLSDQAQRTAPTRIFLYHQTLWSDAPVCLDIGCGAGAITPEIALKIPHSIAIGLDIDPSLLTHAVRANQYNQATQFIFADAMALPLRRSIVEFAFSHFTMMWISNRKQALNEIFTSLHPQGVLACIEPDYSGRVEVITGESAVKPKPPFPIVTVLTRLGADPCTGGHLPKELAELNFENIQFGVLSWTFNVQAIKAEIDSEEDLLKEKGISWRRPAFIYTPIFWVFGFKSS